MVVTERGVGANEVLLELMVRIASHPDQWDRVHKLLHTIDQDLKTSRSVVTQLQTLANLTDIKNNSLETSTPSNDKLEASISDQHRNITINKNNTIKKEKKLEHQLMWPNFDQDSDIIKIVNSSHTKINNTQAQNTTEKTKNKPSKSPYPKNFTYHRVTGKPDSSSKNPRAYIAVSVIAPKSTSQDAGTSGSEEDMTLENELHQLKPWSHLQNLKNMESLRSKWVVQRNQKNKKS